MLLIQSYYRNYATELWCIHVAVVLLSVAKELGNTGDMLLDDRPYVKGRDGQWRATSSAQKLCFIPLKTHFVKRSTQKKRDRSALEREKVKESKKQRRELFEVRKVQMESRHEKGHYCKCDKDDDGTKMVMCSDCKEWYHVACLTKSEFVESKCVKGRWRCPTCFELLT